MSKLTEINKAFEAAIHEQIKAKLEMRDGQVIVVRKFPSAADLKDSGWKRYDEMIPEIRKQMAQARIHR